jgi:hypothetical protein
MALAYISRYPVWIAEMAVPADARCSIAKTGPPRHFTVWGDPRVVLRSVRAVYRQRDSGDQLERV